jgi:UPF0271 protein
MRVNCDIGEAFGAWQLGDDEAIMPHIALANVACGFHAGDPTVMAETVALAKRHGVAVGAHPSYPDLQGFGRRVMEVEPAELTHGVLYQTGALRAFLDAEGMELSHIKAHGALYGHAARDGAVADAIAAAAAVFGVPLWRSRSACASSIPFLPPGIITSEKTRSTSSPLVIAPSAASALATRVTRQPRWLSIS